MCKILTALDAASDRVAGMTKPSTVKSPSEPSPPSSDDEGVPYQIEDDDDEKNEHCSPSLSSNSSNHHSSVEEEEEEDDDDDQSIPVITRKAKEE